MVQTERRPFGVVYAAAWGLAMTAMLLARAAGQEAVPALLPSGVVTPITLIGIQAGLAAALFLTAAGVYKLVSWSRRPAMFAFLLATAGTTLQALEGSLFAFVVIALNLAAIVCLVMDSEAFRNERPEVDDSGSAVYFGTP
jgi:hypothetical protein